MMKKILMNKPGKRKVVVDVFKKDVLVVGLILGEKKGDYHLNLLMHHVKGNLSGKVLIKGVVKNGAKVRVRGKIKIDKNCGGVDSFLEIRLLILDDGSVAEADPELEIESGDVRASHAATVSKINQEDLFYLTSRGIEREKARELVVNGFLKEITDKIKNDV